MTLPARISQADMERATKAAASAGVPARVVMYLEARRIDIILGESPVERVQPDDASAEWSDDDV